VNRTEALASLNRKTGGQTVKEKEKNQLACKPFSLLLPFAHPFFDV
jgi:hypothetical protein